MFIIINLIFYFGFDSSDESKQSSGIDDTKQIESEENTNLEHEITNPINP